ncbi:MAG: HAMP domain-containing histidine kinase [candidate division Zixibacteria bacterium]|nr:HAMP domain-containing histidine kinase [candidate division Zixibacteria bacterium]
MDLRHRMRQLVSPAALKGYFFLVGALLTVAFLFHAQTTVRDLERNQRELIRAFGVFFITQAVSDRVSEGTDVSLLLDQIQQMNIPMIVTDSDGHPTVWKGLDLPQTPDDPAVIEQVRSLVAVMDVETEPVLLEISPGLRATLHYQYSPSVRRMRWLPFVEIGLAGLFVFISLFIYRNIHQLEQRHIWIGMAKETAHQFGTPLSALSGWLELIRMELNPEGMERRGVQRKFDTIIEEMSGDIARLNKIASRFSQIGSIPELRRQDMRAIITGSVDYLKARMPQHARGVAIDTAFQTEVELIVEGNRELLEWVIENLLKNALDAMERAPGRIQVTARRPDDGRTVSVLIRDTGKGIAPNVFGKIFKPGYTTKKRGWGLGLTLAKRIIEEYHSGRLTLRESRPGVGTTFEIVLPVSSTAT